MLCEGEHDSICIAQYDLLLIHEIKVSVQTSIQHGNERPPPRRLRKSLYIDGSTRNDHPLNSPSHHIVTAPFTLAPCTELKPSMRVTHP